MSDKITTPEDAQDNLIIVNDKVDIRFNSLSQDELRDEYNKIVLREALEGLTSELKLYKNTLGKLIRFNIPKSLVA